MATLLICRGCGKKSEQELAIHQQELVVVGMLEQHCAQCGADTRWGRAEDYRRVQRRASERRRGLSFSGSERRSIERRRLQRRAARG